MPASRPCSLAISGGGHAVVIARGIAASVRVLDAGAHPLVDDGSVAAAMVVEADLAVEQIQQLHGRDEADGEADGVRLHLDLGARDRVVVAVDGDDRDRLDLIGRASGFLYNVQCVYWHSGGLELGGDGSVAPDGAVYLDDGLDLDAALKRELRGLKAEVAGAEDHHLAAGEGLVAVHQRVRGVGAHRTGEVPAGETHAEVARSGGDDQVVILDDPGLVFVGEAELRAVEHAACLHVLKAPQTYVPRRMSTPASSRPLRGPD